MPLNIVEPHSTAVILVTLSLGALRRLLDCEVQCQEPLGTWFLDLGEAIMFSYMETVTPDPHHPLTWSVDTGYSPDAEADRYPGRDLGASYVLVNDEAFGLTETPDHRADYYLLEAGGRRAEVLDVFLDRKGYPLMGDRFPVVTFGSNRSPDHLRFRFRNIRDCAVPVLRAKLHGAAVVFPAHVSSYGVVTSTLMQEDRSTSEVNLMFLDEEQLDALHDAEQTGRNFHLAYLEKCSLELRSGECFRAPCAFVGRYHVAKPEGGVKRLASVAAESPLPAMELGDAMKWLLEITNGAPSGSRRFRNVGELQSFARRDEQNRDYLRGIMAEYSAGDGLELVVLDSPEDPRPQPLPYSAIPTRWSLDPKPDYLVKETLKEHRVSGTYVIGLSHAAIVAAGVRPGEDVVVENRFSLRRPSEPLMLRALARVVDLGVEHEPAATADTDSLMLLGPLGSRAALDKTLRTGLAVRVGDGVNVRAASEGRRNRLRSRIARLFSCQYIYCRVQKAYYPDMEKAVCRIPEEAIQVIGSSHGGSVVLEGVVEDAKGGLTVKPVTLKLLEADAEILAERRENSGERFSSYYPDCAYLLGVNRDIYPIFLDKDYRTELGLDQCSVVRLRRSTKASLSEESVSFLLVVLGAVIGLAPTIGGTRILGVPASGIVAAAILFTGVSLITFNVRKRTPS